MSAHSPRAMGLAAAFVSLSTALLPLTGNAQSATVNWGTYLGGVHTDRISAVVKADVFAYAIGTTNSPDLGPNAPTGPSARPSPDIVVSRFNMDNGSLSTTGLAQLVFGGNGVDEPAAAVLGPDNALYIVGKTTSTVAGGITPAPARSANLPPVAQRGGSSAFVAKVLLTGTLEWFMFLDGSMDDAATGIVTVGNHIYVTGWTRSTNFMGTVTAVPAGANGFVTQIQIDTQLPTVGWSTLPTIIGGAMDDLFHGIALAGTSKLYVAGTTNSTSFAYAPTRIVGTYKGGTTDAIAARLDVESGSLDWVTFVGGQGADQGNAIAVGTNSPSIVVAGTTNSPNNLGAGAPMTYTDAFAARLYPSGQLKFSEVLQGNFSDEVLAITRDSNDNIYIGGRTSSDSFPRLAASGFDTSIESGTALREGFVWLAPREGGDGWVSLVGGNGVDEVTSLSLLTNTELIVGLQTASDMGLPGTPVVGQAYDGSLSTPPDGYLLRVDVKTINGPANVSGGVFVRRQQDNVLENDATTASTSALYANWDAFTTLPGVTKFEWAIGTEDLYALAKPWTSVGLSTTAGATNLQLQPGTQYYVTVRASNTFGLTAIERSGGILVTYPDGGVPPPPDAGTPDAGTPDAGTDGGTPGPGDGGGGGNPDEDPNSPVGWGCASGGGGMPLLVLLSLFALALLSRRLGAR